MSFSRRGSFSSMFGRTASKKKEKVRLGKNFLQDWEDLDKAEIKEHEQIKQLEEYVRKGLVTQEMYERLVRENKEKRLGLFKNKVVKETFVEKPIIQGYLQHRIKKGKKYRWRRFHFTLYRARLIWRKKKDTKVIGTLFLNKNFSLEELETMSSAQQGARGKKTSNKYVMRNSFQLTCVGKSWEYSAESDQLKKYWFHTLGLTINRFVLCVFYFIGLLKEQI